MKKKEEPKIYRTSDLALAVYLMMNVKKYDLVKISERKFEFVFDPDDSLEALVRDFYDNKAKVSPLDYYNNMRMLKNRMYESTR